MLKEVSVELEAIYIWRRSLGNDIPVFIVLIILTSFLFIEIFVFGGEFLAFNSYPPQCKKVLPKKLFFKMR
jgi:hypothetical protein